MLILLYKHNFTIIVVFVSVHYLEIKTKKNIKIIKIARIFTFDMLFHTHSI